MTLVWRPGFQQFDADAATYIEAVEAADTQALETGVRSAINDFVTGCKSDGIWDAIKASCILAGARTLNGALVPLVGTAPTNYNFVSGDYNRETGLKGDGSTKYLDSNRNNNVDPQDDNHLSVYRTTNASGTGGLIGSPSLVSGTSVLFDNSLSFFDFIRVNSSFSVGSLQFPSTGLIGATRPNATTIFYRFSGSDNTATNSSQSPDNDNIYIFKAGGWYTDSRIAFYSIGESLDLAKLDTRVSNLITAIGAAIP